MRRPVYGGRSVPETDGSVGPAVATGLIAAAAFLAVAFPLFGAAVAGGVAVAVGRRLLSTLRTRLSRRRGRRLCLPGTRICVVV